MIGQQTWARVDAPGHQVIHVTVARGYRPSRIAARAGLPLRVVFHREDPEDCLERVIFSSPHVVRHLDEGGATPVELPAQPAGEVRFTCAMGRYHGLIELVDDRARSPLGRLRARLGRAEGPLWLALALWACTLPLIALAAVLFLDPTAALAAAGLVLVASLAVCLLGFRSSGLET